jgi:hypothetical protein
MTGEVREIEGLMETDHCDFVVCLDTIGINRQFDSGRAV